MDILSRFRSKTELMESGCHEWRSTLHRGGYGKFWFNGKQSPAHRVAWELLVGEIPEGSWVLHKCDNRKCVNPEHLYLGDAKQNKLDTIERCDWYGNMQVSFDTIKEIRARYENGGVTQQQLADEYGIHQTQVSRLVKLKQRISK
jgi:predicted XRE-type DNA-binding protein